MTILTQYYEERGQLVTDARDLLNKAEAETDTTKAAELEQRHDALVAQTPPELLGLVMGEKIDGYAKIGVHPHFPQRHLA